MFFENVIGILEKYWELLLSGIGYTMLISLTGTVIGLLIGLMTGIIRTIPISKVGWIAILQKIANGAIAAYVEIFRGTPMMVQAMVIFWGYAFMMGGKTLSLVPAGIFIVSINTGAYMAEIVRGGIISIDKGQFEGAAACGMNHFQTMVHVVIPQVMRNILPSISNEFVINIKDTSVLNVIGFTELYFYAKSIVSQNYLTFETYIFVALVYFILTFTVTCILRLIEKKLEFEVKATFAEYDARFGRDKQKIETIEQGNRVTQKALLALLKHSIDGNNIDALKKAEEDLSQFLIER